MLNHLAARELFNRYDIPLEGIECASISDAEEIVSKGGTYFLKLVSSSEEATHKTEFGYVRMVTDSKSLHKAWDEMTATASSNGHKDISFILQEGRSGHEVMIGAKRDPIFGFQIIFTPEGGKYAEIVAGAVHPSVRVGMVDEKDALELIKEHPLSPIIMGARGERPVDLKSLSELISKLSRLMDENPEVLAIDLNPVFATPEGISVVDARVETGEPSVKPITFYTNRDLSAFKHPKRALVVLSSAKPGSVGMILLENVLKIVGDVVVMLPSGRGRKDVEALGVEIVNDVPNGCDLLVYAGLSADAPPLVAKFREKGGAGMVIVSADFSETGNKDLEEDLRKSAADMPYIGPNGLGVYSGSLNTFFLPKERTVFPSTGGSIALFSQSGGLCLESFGEYLYAHNVPVEKVFSLGNGSGISFTELVNSAAANPLIKVIVIHLEGGLKEGEGPFFIQALKDATAVKPVIVLPAGLSAKGRMSAASHTGRMTSGGDALLAALKQGGATVAETEEELRMALWMLHAMPSVQGDAVIFTTGGGKGVFATDIAERIGLPFRDKLPTEFSAAVGPMLPSFADPTSNPLDFTGSINLDGMLAILKNVKMLDSPGIFHVVYQVPGVTLRFVDGKPVRMDALDALDSIAGTIKRYDLPIVLNICGQASLSKVIEERAERHGIVVTRATPAELTMRAMRLTMEIWRRYPKIDLRQNVAQVPEMDITTSGNNLLAASVS